MVLEDKEKEIVSQIRKYKEGLHRNENKDQVQFISSTDIKIN